jgi:hypothetical protein
MESITLLKEFWCLENPSGPFDESSWVFVPATAASKIHTTRGMPCHTNGSNCAHIGSSAMVLVCFKKGVERTGWILPTACETLVSSFLNKLTSEFFARFTTLTGTSRLGTMNLYQHARFSFYPRKHYVHRWGASKSAERIVLFFSFWRGAGLVLRSSISTALKRRNSQTSPKNCRADVERKPIKFQSFCHHHVPPGSGRRFR